jgi:hypothetical protein
MARRFVFCVAGGMQGRAFGCDGGVWAQRLSIRQETLERLCGGKNFPASIHPIFGGAGVVGDDEDRK